MDFLYFLSGLRTPALDLFFQLVTYAAQELFVVAVICWLFWCADKALAYRLGLAYFLSALAVQGLKITMRIPRPWVLDPGFEPVASAVPGATGYSFPSGHTQSGTAFFTVLAFSCRRLPLRLLCAGAFLLIGLSRMYLGVHTPADVLVSMALTLLLSSAVCLLRPALARRPSLTPAVSLVLLLFSAALLLYDLGLVSAQTLDTANAMDCCKACGAGVGFAAGFYLERRFIQFSLPRTRAQKLLRFCPGLAAAALIEFGMKLLLPETLPLSFLRYFLIVLWILAVYPFLFSRRSSVFKKISGRRSGASRSRI